MKGIGGTFADVRPRAKRTAKSRASGNAFQLKITLRGSKPPIWRRIVVPDVTLDRLHDVIQVVMGWADSHLHLFEINDIRYHVPDPDGDDDGFGADFEDSRGFRLSEVAGREKAKFRYEYDFGDSWQHEIVVEKIIPASENPAVMVCLAGKGRCPNEDSGGIWGWYHMLEILANPKDPEYVDIKEWMGDVDPDEFSKDRVTKALSRLKI